METLFPSIVPGLKWCPKCLNHSYTFFQENSASEEIEEVSLQLNKEEMTSKSRASITNVFDETGISPLTLHGLNQQKKLKACKRKVEKVKKKLIWGISSVASLEESILDDTDDDESAPSVKKMKKESEDFNLLL